MLVKFSAAAVVVASCLLAQGAMAQDQTQVPADPATPLPASDMTPAPAPAPAPAVVPKNTQIVIEITDLVSSKTAKIGDTFNLKLAEPVTLDGAVVIPAGTPGKGEVIDAAKAGMGGKSGKLVLAVRYLDFQGSQVAIHGLKLDIVGKDNFNTAVAATVAVGIIGLAVTGGNMEVQPGTLAHAKLAADFVPTAPAADAPPSTPAPAADATPAPATTDAPADPVPPEPVTTPPAAASTQ